MTLRDARILVTGRDRPGRPPRRARPGRRQRGDRGRALQGRGAARPARGGRRAMRQRRLRAGHVRRRPRRRRLRVQLRGRQEQQVGDRPRRATRRPPDCSWRTAASAQAFLHCSSTGVYEAADGSPQRETDPLGDNHRVMMPTYSISKIAAEAVVRTTCRLFDVPTTIARLNVPYGDGGGWPAFHLALMSGRATRFRSTRRPEPFQPDPRRRHPRDPARDARGRVGSGDDRQLGRRRGDEHRSVVRVHGRARRGRADGSTAPTNTIGGIPTENSKRPRSSGPTTVGWKDGFRRMVEAQRASVGSGS